MLPLQIPLLLLSSTLLPATVLSQRWPFQSYTSFSWNAPVLSYEKTAATIPGYLFFASIGGDATTGEFNAPTIMTDEGELIWRPESGFINGTRNFDLQSLNGTNLLTYWIGDHNDGYGCGYGAVIMLDDTYTQKYNVCVADSNIVPIKRTYINQPCILDSHESRITSRGTLLATVRNVTRADLSSRGGEKDGYLLDSLFYEIDIETQEVILSWSAYEHNDQIGMFALSATSPGSTSASKPWDFFHMNSVYDVPEPLGGYLVSSRYLSSIIKLDSKGNIEWYIDGANGGGNFSLPTSGDFSFQHCAIAANVTDSALQITLFDNQNRDDRSALIESSGLELNVDLYNYEASKYRRVLPSNFTASRQTGSYQSLPENHVLIDYGHPPIFNEFDAENRLIYQASAGVLAGEVYRTYRYNFTAYPTTLPSIYADQTSIDNTTVYVSWNGATQVDSWKFEAGESCSTLLPLSGSYTKTAFETVVNLPISNMYVQAVAYAAGSTTALAKSYLVTTKNGNSTNGADGSKVINCGST